MQALCYRRPELQFGAPLIAGTLQDEWNKVQREFVIDGKVYEVSSGDIRCEV